ncbi:MAG: hypothetical protein GY778_23850 [bacterium]|nr:hypothetical protein [bacterium]
MTTDPAVPDVEIVTDEEGAFSAIVPLGVYTLTVEDGRFEALSKTVNVADGATTSVALALTPVAAVALTASAEGDAVPGGTVAATVSVEALDGSAEVESYAWAQSNSVAVAIEDGDTATASVTLPDVSAYKEELFMILAEPPIGEEELPPNVPLPEGEFPGGLQDRFQVVGLNPFSLEEAALVTLTVTVTTSSGTYTQDVEIHTELPWAPSPGLRNVPVGESVLLQGMTQAAYDWTLSTPDGSEASLTDGSTQNPYFTPDISGAYALTVTNSTADPAEEVTIEIDAGTWEGAITGQDADGRPLADNCTVCHTDGGLARDMFTPWAQTGHAEIFTNNLNTSTHYGEGCFACHTVGFDAAVENGGIDEAPDYGDFLDSGLINVPSDDNWTTVLADSPETAQLANIQCENCHGPQNSSAHTAGDSRVSLTSDVCAVCHGEPLRHARHQQWQLSGHANYELAIDEGESGSCARCHTVNGFLAWLPILLDDDPATDPLDDVEVTWTPDETHPQTCVTCHDPHDIGTTTGVDTDAIIRISGDTPPLVAGYTVFGAGRGAICMTCHNSRRGLRNDATVEATKADGDAGRAPHGSSQTDVLMGQNAYLVGVGVRGSHSLVTDTCVNCHMDQTPPPELLAYQGGGTNHTFFAADTICANCHDEIEAESMQVAFEASAAELKALIESALEALMADVIADGNTIDLGGLAVIDEAGDIGSVEFGEFHGRQSIAVTLADGTTFEEPFRVVDVAVLDGDGEPAGELYDFASDDLVKAGWNWNLAMNDGSKGAHNPPFVFELLDAAIDALNDN